MCTVVRTKPIAWGVAAALWVFLFGLVVWDAGCQKTVPLAKPAVTGTLVAQRASSVAIQRYCDGKADAYGSGLATSSEDVVTVRHVVLCEKGKATFVVRFASGETYPMKLAKVITLPNIIGKYSDGYARLTTMNGAHFTNAIADAVVALPRRGEVVCALHSVPDIGTSCGVVLNVVEDGKPTFSFSLKVEPGNSGSPIFDSNGKLVGFAVDCWTDGNGQCYTAGGDGMISLGALYL